MSHKGNRIHSGDDSHSNIRSVDAYSMDRSSSSCQKVYYLLLFTAIVMVIGFVVIVTRYNCLSDSVELQNSLSDTKKSYRDKNSDHEKKWNDIKDSIRNRNRNN